MYFSTPNDAQKLKLFLIAWYVIKIAQSKRKKCMVEKLTTCEYLFSCTAPAKSHLNRILDQSTLIFFFERINLYWLPATIFSIIIIIIKFFWQYVIAGKSQARRHNY